MDMADTPKPSTLTPAQAGQVERARQALECSEADGDPANLSRNLGALEVHMGWLLAIIADLAGGQQ